MNSYYLQTANEIFPIFGVSSVDEAENYVDPADHAFIVETEQEVYMNLSTGSVDFAAGWDNLEEVVKVRYDSEAEQWVEE
jgi:hypothetical protein